MKKNNLIKFVLTLTALFGLYYFVSSYESSYAETRVWPQRVLDSFIPDCGKIRCYGIGDLCTSTQCPENWAPGGCFEKIVNQCTYEPPLATSYQETFSSDLSRCRQIYARMNNYASMTSNTITITASGNIVTVPTSNLPELSFFTPTTPGACPQVITSAAEQMIIASNIEQCKSQRIQILCDDTDPDSPPPLPQPVTQGSSATPPAGGNPPSAPGSSPGGTTGEEQNGSQENNGGNPPPDGGGSASPSISGSPSPESSTSSPSPSATSTVRQTVSPTATATPTKSNSASTSASPTRIPCNFPIDINQLDTRWNGNYYGTSTTQDIGFDINVNPNATTRGAEVRADANGTIGTRFGTGDGWGKKRLWIEGTNDPYNHYYAHLDQYAPGIQPGTRVTKGQIIGYVRTPTNGKNHLHFGLSPKNPNNFNNPSYGLQYWSGNNWINPDKYIKNLYNNNQDCLER